MQHASGDTRMSTKFSDEISEAKRLLGRDRRRWTILKLIFPEQGIQLRTEFISLTTTSCEHYIGPWGSLNGCDFLDPLSNNQLTTLLHTVSS
jgi:hypothetical protein